MITLYMNIKLISLICLWMLAISTLTDASDMTADAYANKYYAILNVPRPASSDVSDLDLMDTFFHQVPLALQAEVLDQMLDKACGTGSKNNYRVIYPILVYVGVMSNLKISERFDAHLHDLANNPFWGARRAALDLMIRLNRPKDQVRILAALNDSHDDVREIAVRAVGRQSNAAIILQKYVQDHNSDPGYNRSVLDAKAQLKALSLKASVDR